MFICTWLRLCAYRANNEQHDQHPKLMFSISALGLDHDPYLLESLANVTEFCYATNITLRLKKSFARRSEGCRDPVQILSEGITTR